MYFNIKVHIKIWQIIVTVERSDVFRRQSTQHLLLSSINKVTHDGIRNQSDPIHVPYLCFTCLFDRILEFSILCNVRDKLYYPNPNYITDKNKRIT